mmetsp:Transcript_14986/g.26252  ORF Transcript_14986/g.26252 Transcript_14986/m.26252 type:complete len:159 (-) Transcript_14986:28-504(-)
MAIVKSEERKLVEDVASLTPGQVNQLQDYEHELYRKAARNSAYLVKEIHYNTLAREWSCKWSEEDQKMSLTECQRVLEQVAVPGLRKVQGMLSVQRVVCGDCKEFKVICKLGLDAFEDWSSRNFYPEEDVIQSWHSVEGVSKIEIRTYTLEPVFGPGR